MAPKDESLKSKKRKRVTADNKPDKSTPTKPHKPTTKTTAKDGSQGKKAKEQNPSPKLTKPTSFDPNSKPTQIKKPVPQDALEKKMAKKERTEGRKKRKPHYTLKKDLAVLWEKMRRRDITKEEKSKFVSEALQKMKGRIPEIASSNVSSRVLQTCIKFCSEDERDAVYEELKPHLLTLSKDVYAVHLVSKMFDNASKAQLPRLISLLHGHVAKLLKHSVGSIVVECAYQAGNASQKRELLTELYSTELKLFKDMANIKETRIVDIISKLGLNKSSVQRHMHQALQPIWEKGISDHEIIHKALVEYLSIAEKWQAEEVVKTLSGDLLLRMAHKRDGSRIGMLCVQHGSAKERKKIVKAMKGHIGKLALDPHGSLVLVAVLSTVDDTKIVTNIVIRELKSMLKELALDKSGRRPLLQLLHPYCQRYISPEDLACLNDSIPSLCFKGGEEADETKDKPAECPDNGEDNLDGEDMEVEDTQLGKGSKKDPFVRRQELLVKSGLAESLIDVCTESTEELLKSNFGKEVLYEVATGGADGILRPTLDEKLSNLYRKIAALAAESKSDESEHVFENFHSSRTIRKLVLDCPAFAVILWEAALKGKCKIWVEGHSSRLVAAFAESSDTNVHNLAKKELQPLIEGGLLKIPAAKPAKK